MTKRANRRSSDATLRIPAGVTKFLLGVAVEAGADQFGTSLEESSLQLAQLKQLIHSMAAPTKAPAAVPTPPPLVASSTST
jgi:hypothetical protein